MRFSNRFWVEFSPSTDRSTGEEDLAGVQGSRYRHPSVDGGPGDTALSRLKARKLVEHKETGR